MINLGNQTQVMGSTHRNEVNSCFHDIFDIPVESHEHGSSFQDHVHLGKLRLVDLPRSGKQNKVNPYST